MTLSVPYASHSRHARVMQAVAGIVVAVLLISQTACHGCPVADTSDPATVFSSALSDRAVTSMSPQGGTSHATKCRPDSANPLPGIFTARAEAVCNAVTAPCRTLHLARSSRELLMLKGHLLI